MFDLKDQKSALNCLQVAKSEVGIYIFVVDSDFVTNPNLFDTTKYAAQTNENLRKDGCLKKGDCFYIGKSEKGIFKRVNEHIENNTEKTYSLRLNFKERIHTKDHLRLFSFVLKTDFEKYKKLFLPVIESYLYESLNPMVGSKRA